MVNSRILTLLLVISVTPFVMAQANELEAGFKIQKIRSFSSLERIVAAPSHYSARQYGLNEKQIRQRKMSYLNAQFHQYASMPSRPKTEHDIMLDLTPKALQKVLGIKSYDEMSSPSIINGTLHKESSLSAYVMAMKHFDNKEYVKAIYWFKNAQPQFNDLFKLKEKQLSQTPYKIDHRLFNLFYHAGPEFRIAQMYLAGLGVKKSIELATFWLEKGALSSDIHSALVIINMIDKQEIKLTDITINPLEIAAKLGNSWAKFQIATNERELPHSISMSDRFIYCLDALVTELYLMNSLTCEAILDDSTYQELTATKPKLNRRSIYNKFKLLPNPLPAKTMFRKVADMK